MTIRPLYPAVEPTLNLDFANTKRLDPRISFLRASTGTYFGEDGLIKSAAVNEARFDHNPVNGESLGLLVEEARTNGQTYSERFDNSTWGKGNSVIVLPESGLAPDNTWTADKLIPVNGNRFTALFGSASYVNGTTYSFSVFVKKAGARYAAVTFGGGNQAVSGLTIDLDTGVGTVFVRVGFISILSSGVQALPNGWYRIHAVATRGGFWDDQIRIYASTSNIDGNTVDSITGDGSSGVLIWGAQLEAGSFPTSYIPTPATFTGRASTATFYDSAGVVQTAASGVARSNAFFPDSNGVMRPAGLLLETAATNLVTYSEQFDNAAWDTFSSSVTVTPNAAVAPDGATTADKITPSTSAGSHLIRPTTPIGISNQTLSVYAKAAGYSWIALTGWTGSAFFNLSNGTIGSVTGVISAAIQKLPNGWYRCSINLSTQGGTGINFYVATGDGVTNYAGDGTSGILLWGAQLEASPYPTSYIPTIASTVTRAADTSTSATVTRSADTASFAGVNFSSWFNQTEGTIYTETSATSYSQGLWRFIGSTRWYALSSTASFYSELYDFVGGGAAVTAINGLPTSNKLKTIATVDNNSLIHKACMNGGVVTNNSYDYQFNLTQMSLGFISDFPIYMNSRISRLTYWPVRLSDAILQSITR